MRRGHPDAKRRLTAARFARALRVLVSRRGRLRDPLDDQLEARGLRRRVVAAVPFSAALSFVKQTNLVSTVAANASGPLARAMGLVLKPLPFEIGPVPIVQSWHEYFESDRGHRWLRQVTREILVNQPT